MAGFFDKLRGLFKKPQGVRPSILPKGEGGHRGIAAGDVPPRARALAQGQVPYTEEEMDQWKPFSGDEVEAFLYNQEPLMVHSTNVSMAQYYIDDQKLMVEFLNGAAYMYSAITEQEALNFAQAPSKGTWIWDHVRVRGSKTGSRKSFVRIR